MSNSDWAGTPWEICCWAWFWSTLTRFLSSRTRSRLNAKVSDCSSSRLSVAALAPATALRRESAVTSTTRTREPGFAEMVMA